MAHHELFGEVLAAFECGACLRRTYHEQLRATFGKVVVDTGYQGILVAYHYHLYVVVSDKTFHGFEVEWRYCHIGAVLRCAAVAGGYVEIV